MIALRAAPSTGEAVVAEVTITNTVLVERHYVPDRDGSRGPRAP
ncbi:hypothetical protein P376_1874 [Streptomyces sp. HCCB10043]|uniref:Predicted protein n=1 Tax=Streptomyces filamentosus NRRL 15998 TaxID=457431 RepID=D6AQR3_STRFL|nr:predicted protein [Streptomyces filamentosus NRRL 15998]ESU50149.1 hypothetical protein P376_1874 [Streptomyces sp. HCCB10043]